MDAARGGVDERRLHLVRGLQRVEVAADRFERRGERRDLGLLGSPRPAAEGDDGELDGPLPLSSA